SVARAAGDTVAVTGPGPSHRVAYRDVDLVRHKHETRSHGHIDNLAGTRWHAAHGRVPVLIHNVDGVGGGLFLVRCANVSVTRFSLRQKYRRKRDCEQRGDSYECV